MTIPRDPLACCPGYDGTGCSSLVNADRLQLCARCRRAKHFGGANPAAAEGPSSQGPDRRDNPAAPAGLNLQATPTGDGHGGWHDPDPEERWDDHRGEPFRVFDLNDLAKPKGPR